MTDIYIYIKGYIMIYTCIFKFPITWVYTGREDAVGGYIEDQE